MNLYFLTETNKMWKVLGGRTKKNSRLNLRVSMLTLSIRLFSELGGQATSVSN